MGVFDFGNKVSRSRPLPSTRARLTPEPSRLASVCFASFCFFRLLKKENSAARRRANFSTARCGSSNAPAPPDGRAAGCRPGAGPPEGPRSARPSAVRRPDRPCAESAAREKTLAPPAPPVPPALLGLQTVLSLRRLQLLLPRLQELKILFFKKYIQFIKNPIPITSDIWRQRLFPRSAWGWNGGFFEDEEGFFEDGGVVHSYGCEERRIRPSFDLLCGRDEETLPFFFFRPPCAPPSPDLFSTLKVWMFRPISHLGDPSEDRDRLSIQHHQSVVNLSNPKPEHTMGGSGRGGARRGGWAGRGKTRGRRVGSPRRTVPLAFQGTSLSKHEHTKFYVNLSNLKPGYTMGGSRRGGARRRGGAGRSTAGRDAGGSVRQRDNRPS